MSEAQLKIEFLSFWHTGTGKGTGADIDALTDKMRNNLPFVSGRHLKGVLRQAAHCAESWHWFNEYALPDGPATCWTDLFFGSHSQTINRNETFPGMVKVTNATLSDNDSNALLHNQNQHLIPSLYQRLFSTAINEDGVAKKHSLRCIEVVLPTNLFFKFDCVPKSIEAAHRAQQESGLAIFQVDVLLQKILPLVDHLGGWRNRGLGEAIVSLLDAKEKQNA